MPSKSKPNLIRMNYKSNRGYFRVYGSYENLESGQTTDALIDMSGMLVSF